MNDSRMREFRAFCLKATKADSRYRGNENVAKQTVNSDFLMPIYNFYHWVQKQGTYHPNILGFDPANKFSYQITSSLLLKEIAVSRNEKPNNNFENPTNTFSACCFYQIGIGHWLQAIGVSLFHHPFVETLLS